MMTWIAALVVIWSRSLWHLSSEWSLNPQYQYGFAVPILVLYLAWIRVRSAAQNTSAKDEPSPCCGRSLIALALLLFFLAELILAVDSQWRIISDLQVGAATILTAVWLREIGGRSLLRAMAFPLCFIWIAVPWPTFIEFPITQALMQMVTGFTVEVMNAVGIAALQRGNVIEMSRGVVGVETACSGVQSFQASLMVSLFLGAMWRLALRRRVMLVALSVVIAFAGNLLRTVVLTWIVSRDGAVGLEKHHDMTGYAVSALIFLMIFCLARALVSSRESAPRQITGFPVFKPVRGRAGSMVLAAMILIPLLVSGWFHFRRKQAHIQQDAMWQVRGEGAVGGWSASDLQTPAESLKILGCSESRSVLCQSPEGVRFQLHHFFWKPSIEVPSLATAHTPDICLPNAGWTLARGPEPVTLSVGKSSIPGAFFHFNQSGSDICVFHAIWHGGEPQKFSARWHFGEQFRDRLAMIWEGKRNRGHEVLTLIYPAMRNATHEEDICSKALDFALQPLP